MKEIRPPANNVVKRLNAKKIKNYIYKNKTGTAYYALCRIDGVEKKVKTKNYYEAKEALVGIFAANQIPLPQPAKAADNVINFVQEEDTYSILQETKAAYTPFKNENSILKILIEHYGDISNCPLTDEGLAKIWILFRFFNVKENPKIWLTSILKDNSMISKLNDLDWKVFLYSFIKEEHKKL